MADESNSDSSSIELLDAFDSIPQIFEIFKNFINISGNNEPSSIEHHFIQIIEELKKCKDQQTSKQEFLNAQLKLKQELKQKSNEISDLTSEKEILNILLEKV